MDVSSIALGLGLSGNILKDDNINKNNIDKTIKQINRNYINRYNSNEIEKNRNIIYSLNEDNYIKSIKPNTNPNILPINIPRNVRLSRLIILSRDTYSFSFLLRTYHTIYIEPTISVILRKRKAFKFIYK